MPGTMADVSYNVVTLEVVANGFFGLPYAPLRIDGLKPSVLCTPVITK